MQKKRKSARENKMHEDNNKPKWNAKENKMHEDDNKHSIKEMECQRKEKKMYEK